MTIDLFTPVVPESLFHYNFKVALLDQSVGERGVFNEWARDFQDRDGKFVKEFQTTFNSSFWELYLHAVFRELGFSVTWSYARPDFMLTKGNMEIVVEAGAASAAQGKPQEWERELSFEEMTKRVDIAKVNREAIIRLSNTIVEKHRKYVNSYRKLNHVANRPFVIAAGPFEQPYFYFQHDRAIKALLYDYYVDEQAYQHAPERYPHGPSGVSLGAITKDNGSEIQLGFFNSYLMEEVSAVIFSSTATWGKVDALAKNSPKFALFNYLRSDDSGAPRIHTGVPREQYDETLLDGLQVYHNPFAKYPLPPELIRGPGIVQIYYDKEADDWVEEGAHALLWRHVIAMVPRNSEEESSPQIT